MNFPDGEPEVRPKSLEPAVPSGPQAGTGNMCTISFRGNGVPYPKVSANLMTI